MNIVPSIATKTFGRQILKLQKASPKLLFVGGIVGVVGTTVLACKATLKLEDVLDETQKNLDIAKSLEHSDYSEQDRVKDKTYIYIRSGVAIGKLYAPAIALGTLSICALAGSHNILTKRNVALTSAYAAVEKSFAEYRKRVEDELGPDREREVRYDVKEEKSKDESGKNVTVKRPGDPSQYARFFDEYSTSWSRTPEYNFLFLRCQQNYANDKLLSRGHIFLNEVYDMLGIERTKAGAVVGWVVSPEGDNFIDFGIFDGDNPKARDFVNGREGSVLLDFNVDGVIYDKI